MIMKGKIICPSIQRTERKIQENAGQLASLQSLGKLRNRR